MEPKSIFSIALMASILGFVSCKIVTQSGEDEMRLVLRHHINTHLDEDGMREVIPGMTRAAFHDSILGFDGCIDMRRSVQAANNGIETTWKPLRALWRKLYNKLISTADWAALATIVVTEMAAEVAIERGVCVPTPGLLYNDCIPQMTMKWGRIDCDHPQKVNPLRPIPNANAEPYEFHKDELNMTESQTICIMGGHTLGKMRPSESGFNGSFTSHPESLDNEYYQRLINQTFSQYEPRVHNVFLDNATQLRRQWNSADGKALTHSDIRLLYTFEPDERSRPNCYLPPGPTYKKKVTTECPVIKSARDFIQELADDNKKFLKCYGEALTLVIQNGYTEDQLVPTGTEIPPPPPTTPRPPSNSTTDGKFSEKTKKPTAVTTKAPVKPVITTPETTTRESTTVISTTKPDTTVALTMKPDVTAKPGLRSRRESTAKETTTTAATTTPTTAGTTPKVAVETTTLSKKQKRKLKKAQKKKEKQEKKKNKAGKKGGKKGGRKNKTEEGGEDITEEPKREGRKKKKEVETKDASNSKDNTPSNNIFRSLLNGDNPLSGFRGF